jgi:hypothetical protein
MAEATIGALANPATSTAADRGVVATLTEANARLIKQVEDNSNELRELKALIKKESFEKRGQRSFNPSPNNYFWTHGYKVSNTHTSLSCNFPKQGHKREATRTDNMGGSQANKELCSGATTLNNKPMFEDCPPPPLLKPHEIAIVDFGCMGHFLLVNVPCSNKVKSQNPLTVRLPNGATMESSHTAALNRPELNKAASIAHVFPGMANHYLLSVGHLCNEGYTVTFRNASVTICNYQELQILKGAGDLDTGLLRINLRKENQQTQLAVANNVYELRNTGSLVNYLHKAMFSPTKSALLQAVKNGHLVTWPGLTEKAINTHLKLTAVTTMGHMNQRRQYIRSTSKTPITSDIEDITATPATSDTKTHLVYAVLVDQGQLYTDLTGKFPVRSRKGNWYVMVCYVFDCNSVKVLRMKSRSAL